MAQLLRIIREWQKRVHSSLVQDPSIVMVKARPKQIRHFMRLIERSHSLTLDYALGASIIALLPFPKLFWLKVFIFLFMHYQLMRQMGKLWVFDRNQLFLGWMKLLFCLLKAFVFSFAIWLGMIILGIFLPWFGTLALGGYAFAYFWNLGSNLQHFYMNRFYRVSRRLFVANPMTLRSQDEI
jgi:hypothetical protein